MTLTERYAKTAFLKQCDAALQRLGQMAFLDEFVAKNAGITPIEAAGFREFARMIVARAAAAEIRER